MRFIRITPFCLGLLIAATPCLAQTVDSTEDAFAVSQSAAVPPYVVPVMRLVSKTHVQPTTGIVLSESGLVLVPAGFASAGDEIVVLDGGTDIVSNGRTARIEKNFPMDGLQVLSVYGLRRAGAPFADAPLEDGSLVSLTAYPPAEQIAEGAQPLNIETTVTVFGESGTPAVSGDTPLPNVTGPLLDKCGNVAAFSMAHDIQTMETTPGTRYQWRETLLGIIEALGIQPAPSACAAEPPPAEPEIEEPPPPEPEPEQSPLAEPERDEPEPEPEPAEETADETDTVEEEQPTILPPIELDEKPEVETGDEGTAGEAVPAEEPSRGWTWLLLATVLLAAGLGLHRWRRRLVEQEPGPEEESGLAPPPPEKDDPDYPEPALDSVLVLSGSLGADHDFEISCPVSSLAINLVIGRGQADLQIRSAAVSRQHAALNGTADGLTITDLGSNNGTLINGVPCLEGEFMYLEAGDTVTLGDARFIIELKPSGEDG